MSVRIRYVVTTVALIAVAGALALVQARPERPRPRIEPTAAVARAVPPRPLPSAREILDHAERVSLAPAQVARLEALARAWQEETAALATALEAAEDEFARAAESGPGRGMSLTAVQRRSVEFAALSAELRERRRRHGEAASALLTEAQQSLLSTEANSHGGNR